MVKVRLKRYFSTLKEQTAADLVRKMQIKSACEFETLFPVHNKINRYKTINV